MTTISYFDFISCAIEQQNLSDLSVSSIGSRPEPYGTSILQMCRLYWQFKFKFNVNQNEKRKQKRNGWSNLRGGASRPPRRFPRLRFCFRFRFDLRWIWIFPTPPSPGSKAWKKKSRKKRSVAKMKVQVMTINSVQKSSKLELSSGIFGHFKVWQQSPKNTLLARAQ